jgi:hypothetical protein
MHRYWERLVLEIVVLVAVIVVAGIAGLIIWIKRAASCGRIIDAPVSEREAILAGDVLCRHVMTSGSLAVLEFFDWGIRLRGNLISRWIVPRWEARYSELAIAEQVTLPHSRIAVWLRLRDGQGGIGFFRLPTFDVLRLLEEHGVPVNRAIAQVSRVEELYRVS